MNKENNINLLYKLLVVGDVGTGKTSIIRRYVNGLFNTHYKSTIGVDFALKVLYYDENTIVRLQIWDIAGQERFGQMTRVYYKGAIGAIIVFDVTRETTLDSIKYWKEDIDNKVFIPNTTDAKIPVIIMANKVDLIDKNDVIWKDMCDKINNLCIENNYVGWFDVSAKNDINIDIAYKELIKKIIEVDNNFVEENTKNSIILTDNDQHFQLDQGDCNCIL
jgi:Ras-related protein Rab-32